MGLIVFKYVEIVLLAIWSRHIKPTVVMAVLALCIHSIFMNNDFIHFNNFYHFFVATNT